MTERFTYDELSGIYAVELKSGPLSPVPKDLYQRIAETRRAAVEAWEEERAKDPDSAMCEGARIRVRQIRNLSECILRTRSQKVCLLGIRKGMGDDSRIPELPPEEEVLLLQVSGNYRDIREAMKGVSE